MDFFQRLRSTNPHRVGLLFLVVVGVVGMSTIFWGNHPDEADNIVIGALITQGMTLYRDLFTHHAPLPYYWAAGVGALFGPSLFVMRLSVWLYQLVNFYVAMRLSRYYVAIGATALVWSAIHHFYNAHMLIYSSLTATALLVLGTVTIATSNQEIRLTGRHALLLSLYVLVALFSDPRTLFAVAVAVLVIMTVQWRQGLWIGAIITLFTSFYVAYLVLSENFTSFWQDFWVFNTETYAAYMGTSVVRMDDFLDMLRTGLEINQPYWWVLEPFRKLGLYIGYSYFDRWAFTGLLYRLAILLVVLQSLLIRKWRTALFIYLFAATLLLVDRWGMRGQPFVLFGIFCGAWFITATFAEILLQRPRQVLLWGRVAIATVMVCMWVWLGLRATEAMARDRRNLDYHLHFEFYRRNSERLAELQCDVEEVRLAHYPFAAYTNWFANMRPVSRYVLMWPWIADIGLEEDLALLRQPEVLVIARIEDDVIWGKYDTRDYLRELYQTLEKGYTLTEDGWYLSPALAEQCRVKGVL